MKPFSLESLRDGDAGCPSELALDLFVAEEGDPATRQQTEAHCATCASCQARVATRREGWNAHAVDPRVMLAAVRRGADAPKKQRWWLVLVPLAAAAIALGVFLPKEPTTRFKGGAALKVFRFEQGRAREVASGTQFSPGDRLRFVVDLPTAGAVSIIGVDAKKQLYVAWPNDGESPLRAAGASIELPGAVALDDSPGDETLFLVHCAGQESAPRCTITNDGALTCGSGCTLTPFEVKKR